MNENIRTQWGEGTGTPMSTCANPNKPSYDPAADSTVMRRWILPLIRDHWDDLNCWEQAFIMSLCARAEKITRRQACCLKRIYARIQKTSTPET